MQSISEIPMGHLLDLAYLFRMGIIGWQSDARLNYTNYAMLHNLTQTLIAVNSSKSKPKKPQPFSKMFPEHHQMSQLGEDKRGSLADRWLAAAAKLGAPRDASR